MQIFISGKVFAVRTRHYWASRSLALKGKLTPLLNTTHHEISHISARRPHFDFGLNWGLLGCVHGQNTDKQGRRVTILCRLCGGHLLHSIQALQRSFSRLVLHFRRKVGEVHAALFHPQSPLESGNRVLYSRKSLFEGFVHLVA